MKKLFSSFRKPREREQEGLRRSIDRRTAEALKRWTEDGGALSPCRGLGEAADQIGVNKEQLSWYFHRYLHTTFYQWRKEQRIAAAKALLLDDPGISLSELAAGVGIDDKSNMRRQFMEVTGMTPAQWIRANQGRLRDT